MPFGKSAKADKAKQHHEGDSALLEYIMNGNIYAKLSRGVCVSGLLGAAVGVAARRLTSDWLYGAGLSLMLLQGLSFLGYITVDWKKVETDVKQLADHNKDGEVNSKDLMHLLDRFLKFASNGLSDAAGFASGFFIGARYLA